MSSKPTNSKPTNSKATKATKTSSTTPPIAMGTPVASYPSPNIDTSAGPPMPARHIPSFNTLKTLEEEGWPVGLASALAHSVGNFPLRFVVVDNSGSMGIGDGSILRRGRSITGTRWAELTDLCLEMAKVAETCEAPTHFHMLNPTSHGQYFTIADKGQTALGTRRDASAGMDSLKRVMSTSPGSTTPLTESVLKITELIRPIAPELNRNGQQCVVVLATDGLPNSPSTFLRALQDLQKLPVWLVVRLCTSEDDVVDYWSDLDKQLERPLETLDDLASEALEVGKQNPWLAYAPALHIARTMGLKDKIFDLIDERPLVAAQVKQFVENLCGVTGLPEPELDLTEFVQGVGRAQAEMPSVYNPTARKVTNWVDLNRLNNSLGNGGLLGAIANCLKL